MACRQCLDDAAVVSGRICPQCRAPYNVNQLASSAAFQRMLDALPVHCGYRDAECTWTGTRHDVEAHQAGCIHRNVDMQLIMDVRITAVSTDAEATFVLPFMLANVVSIVILWGDDQRTTVAENKTKLAAHVYALPGVYTVRVLPHGPGIDGCWLNHLGYDHRDSPGEGWADKIERFVQLGRLGIVSLERCFQGCKTFNAPVNHLSVGNVRNTVLMFNGASSFNQPVDSWNVSNVTNMEGMFDGASSFNQPVGSWNVSNVTNMEGMFNGASSFNQRVDSWNVSNVTDMEFMFDGASLFNQRVDSWNVSNVTNMRAMFQNATSFNQPVGSWNVSNVTNMEGMFDGASSFNQRVDSWNVSNVTDMGTMFQEATSFNQRVDSWNVSNIISIRSMFAGARSFNQPVGDWNLPDNVDVSRIFHGLFDSYKMRDPAFALQDLSRKTWSRLATMQTCPFFSALWMLFDASKEQKNGIERLKNQLAAQKTQIDALLSTSNLRQQLDDDEPDGNGHPNRKSKKRGSITDSEDEPASKRPKTK
jgi:surface protein